jgi:hypothetical protein
MFVPAKLMKTLQKIQVWVPVYPFTRTPRLKNSVLFPSQLHCSFRRNEWYIPIEKTPRKSLTKNSTWLLIYPSSLIQLQVALWTFLFLILGWNKVLILSHPIHLQSLPFLSLHLQYKPYVSSPWSVWLPKHKEWLSVPQLWHDDRMTDRGP